MADGLIKKKKKIGIYISCKTKFWGGLKKKTFLTDSKSLLFEIINQKKKKRV